MRMFVGGLLGTLAGAVLTYAIVYGFGIHDPTAGFLLGVALGGGGSIAGMAYSPD